MLCLDYEKAGGRKMEKVLSTGLPELYKGRYDRNTTEAVSSILGQKVLEETKIVESSVINTAGAFCSSFSCCFNFFINTQLPLQFSFGRWRFSQRFFAMYSWFNLKLTTTNQWLKACVIRSTISIGIAKNLMLSAKVI